MSQEIPSPATVVAPPRRDPALDGVRGLAVLMVFWFHYGGGLESKNPLIHLAGFFTQACWIGIVIFFALSGFLITGSLWDSISEKLPLRNYFIRRALRILPLYLLALGISFLGAMSAGIKFETIKAFLVYLFFLQDVPYLADIAQKTHSIFPLYHLWTLAVEEQFYLLWPLLLLGVDNRRGARNLCIRVFIFSAFFRLIFALPDLNFGRVSLYDDFLLTHAGSLALGGAVALALRSRDRATGRIAAPVRFLRRYAVPAFYGGIVLFIAIGIFKKNFLIAEPLQFMFGTLGLSVSAAALIALALRPGSVRTFFTMRILGFLGRISYGFYVFHILLQPWFDLLGMRLTTFFLIRIPYSQNLYHTCRLLVAFPLTLMVAIVSFYLLEKPFLRLARKFPMPSALPSGLHLLNSTRRDPTRHTIPAHEFISISQNPRKSRTPPTSRND
jgi:peptidoglycan/LPS O-acetylase OafA/YrhL